MISKFLTVCPYMKTIMLYNHDTVLDTDQCFKSSLIIGTLMLLKLLFFAITNLYIESILIAFVSIVLYKRYLLVKSLDAMCEALNSNGLLENTINRLEELNNQINTQINTQRAESPTSVIAIQ